MASVATSYCYLICRRGEARVKGPVSDGTGRGGMGTSVPWLQSTSCHPAGRTSRPSGRHPQGSDRRLGETPARPRRSPLSGFLLLPGTLLKALQTGGLPLWQRALETITINPPLGQRPRIKSRVPCPLHKLPPFSGPDEVRTAPPMACDQGTSPQKTFHSHGQHGPQADRALAQHTHESFGP